MISRRGGKLQRTKLLRLNDRARNIKMPSRKNPNGRYRECILRRGHANLPSIGTSYGVAKRLAADTSGSRMTERHRKEAKPLNDLANEEEMRIRRRC